MWGRSLENAKLLLLTVFKHTVTQLYLFCFANAGQKLFILHIVILLTILNSVVQIFFHPLSLTLLFHTLLVELYYYISESSFI